MATKKFSPAQIAAQKLFAERARAGTLGKGKRKANPSTNRGLAIYLDAIAAGDTYSESKLIEALSHPSLSESDRDVIRNALKGLPYDHTRLYDAAIKIRNYKGASSPKYNEAAVNKSIALSRSKISAGEGKTIKRLLMGRTGNPGLYDNINSKRARIAAGSGERMRRSGSKGAPTQEAFERSAMTAKRNPITETLIYGLAPGETRDYMEDLMYAGGQKLTQAQIDKVLKAASDAGYHSFRVVGFDMNKKPNFAAAVMRNPDKSKPRTYVKRASQITGAPPSKRLVTRRKMALSAPAGYFPNPKAAMMTGYQVICMHPKKHVVGIFKTMAEAKMVATAMADAKGVPYAVKTVRVHKSHFAI